MAPEAKKRNIGMLAFLGLILIFLCISLAAYLLTGPQGIEERFMGAVGGESEHEEGGGGLFGFNIEGNVILYGLILGILLVACLLGYALLKS